MYWTIVEHPSRQAATSTLHWARDCLGRRSLMISMPTDETEQLLLCSVIPSAACLSTRQWEEVSASSIFSMRIADQPLHAVAVPRRHASDPILPGDHLVGHLSIRVPCLLINFLDVSLRQAQQTNTGSKRSTVHKCRRSANCQ